MKLTWKFSVFIPTLALAVLTTASVAADTSETQGDLQGHWKSACVSGEVFGQTRTDEYLIDGTNQKQWTIYYGGPNCTKPIIRAEWTVDITTTGEEVRPGVKAINITYQKTSVTPLSEAGSHILESWGYCGIQEWPVEQSQDVTSLAGTERCVAPLPVSNHTIYSIIDGTLYLGLGFSSDANRRPSELNIDNPFRRMP